MAAEDHRRLVGLFLRVAPKTEQFPAGEEVGADGQYRPTVRQRRGLAPTGWLPISESRNRDQVEEPGAVLVDSLPLASMSIPPLSDLVTSDVE